MNQPVHHSTGPFAVLLLEELERAFLERDTNEVRAGVKFRPYDHDYCTRSDRTG
jgi:hypothetical protein